MNQRSISRVVSIRGKSLHTGEAVNMTLRPADINHGIIFKRTDLRDKPLIKPLIDYVDDLVRSTTISNKGVKIHTIEHILSALNGCNIDNVLIELDSSEPPILDGSAKKYVEIIQDAEPVEQNAKKDFFILDELVSVSQGSSFIIALPYNGFKITCTSQDNRGVHTQHLSLDIDLKTFVDEISSARTFTIYEDIKQLLDMGKIKGGSLDSAIVIKGDKILTKEPLRFNDEFVRHKILDIIGDLSLLGVNLKAHIIAIKPGHAINSKICKELRDIYLNCSKDNINL